MGEGALTVSIPTVGGGDKGERRLESVQKDAGLYRAKRAYADAFERAGDTITASKLRKCGEVEILCCCFSCQSSWWVTYHCRLRCCPLCARNVSRDRLRFLLAVTATQNTTKLLTLTMKRWTGDPREGIKFLRESVQRFRDSKLMARCIGGAYTIELIPKPDGWHIHAHLLIESPYLPFRRVIKVWAACCRQGTAHVDVRAANKSNIKQYVCKYACKTGLGSLGKNGVEQVEKGIGPGEIVEWFAAVRGSRLWGCFGAWYHFTAQDVAEVDGVAKHVTACPYCGAEKTCFQARAGPWIFGSDWVRMCYVFGAAAETERRSCLSDGREVVESVLSVGSAPEPGVGELVRG